MVPDLNLKLEVLSDGDAATRVNAWSTWAGVVGSQLLSFFQSTTPSEIPITNDLPFYHICRLKDARAISILSQDACINALQNI